MRNTIHRVGTSARLRIAVAILLIGLPTLPAMAQKVYKCTTDGVTTYSQTPCGVDNQTVMDIEPPAPSWPFGERRGTSKPKPTYRCKNAQGEWTEEACKPPESPKPEPKPERPTAPKPSSPAPEIGPEPKASLWDGVYPEVKRHMDRYAHDPGSVEWEGCVTARPSALGWITICDYRARNRLGALTREKTIFIIRGGEVVSADQVR